MMIGRTHMAVGISAAACLAPEFLHMSSAFDLRHIPVSLMHGARPVLTDKVLYYLAAAVGSLMPDLDQKDSLAARKIEHLTHTVMGACMLGAMVLLRLWTSPIAWIALVLIWFGTASRANTLRKVALLVVAAAFVYGAVAIRVDALGAGLAAIWAVGSAFTWHRSFTHSVLGAAVFTAAIYRMAVHVAGGALFWGLSLGYGFHIAADLIAGGTALFWPIQKRIGWRIVKTSGPLDHMIGGAAIIVFVLSLIGIA